MVYEAYLIDSLQISVVSVRSCVFLICNTFWIYVLENLFIGRENLQDSKDPCQFAKKTKLTKKFISILFGNRRVPSETEKQIKDTACYLWMAIASAPKSYVIFSFSKLRKWYSIWFLKMWKWWTNRTSTKEAFFVAFFCFISNHLPLNKPKIFANVHTIIVNFNLCWVIWWVRAI